LSDDRDPDFKLLRCANLVFPKNYFWIFDIEVCPPAAVKQAPHSQARRGALWCHFRRLPSVVGRLFRAMFGVAFEKNAVAPMRPYGVPSGVVATQNNLVCFGGGAKSQINRASASRAGLRKRKPTVKWTTDYNKTSPRHVVTNHASSSDELLSSADGLATDFVTTSTTNTGSYVPSPLDPSAFTGQVVAFVFIAVSVAYVIALLNPIARERFELNDPARKKYVKELMAGEGIDGDTRRLERLYYRKVILASGLRPRGDQTAGGTIVPGIGKDVVKGKKGKKSVETAPSAETEKDE
jgi:hypothetical protein